MNKDVASDSQFEIIRFLYNFKDDNKFYKLDENLLNITSKKEKYMSIYKLRDKALIATDTELSWHADASADVSYTDEIRAKILPKGIVAVESMLQEPQSRNERCSHSR